MQASCFGSTALATLATSATGSGVLSNKKYLSSVLVRNKPTTRTSMPATILKNLILSLIGKILSFMQDSSNHSCNG